MLDDNKGLDINAILKILPHRYPFLLVDKIVELEPGKKAVGYKNVSINEPFFQGHFPGYPVMPGVLVLEAMAQVGAVAMLSLPEMQGKIALFAGMDEVRFRKQVMPGDKLVMQMEIIKMKSRIGKGTGIATVDDQIAAEGTFLFAING